MKYPISLNFKYLSMKIKSEKRSFPLGKIEFCAYWEFYGYDRLFGLRRNAAGYLKVKV